MRRMISLVAAAVAAATPLAALAIDVADGKLSVSGSGEWGFARTGAGGNVYGPATPDGNYDLAMFDLALSARPAPDLVVNAQLGFDSDEVSAEWVFAEWRAHDLFRLRVGKVVQPLGNYAEVRFNGTSRPFFELPQSVYGPSEVGGTAYLGVGATGDLRFESGWTLGYDVYGGQIEIDAFEPYDALRPGADLAAFPGVEGKEARGFVGLRFSVTTPFDLVLRVSGYGGQLDADGGEGKTELNVEGVSALYRGEKLWVSTELFSSNEQDRERTVGGYAEAAYFVTPHWQLALRAEASRTTLQGERTTIVENGDQLLRHAEAAVGVSYWINPSFVLRASYHETRGNRYAVPAAGPLAGLHDGTRSVLAGAQFSF